MSQNIFKKILATFGKRLKYSFSGWLLEENLRSFFVFVKKL